MVRDGVQRLADLPLPFLIDLPNGSSEAVFLIASRNAASGLVPILEWCLGKRTVLDKNGGNGIFLASHDGTMLAKVYKTVESVPEITLGVLRTERRVKRRRVVNELALRVNEIHIVARSDLFFKTHYDANNEEHRAFLESFQIVYPGEIIDN